MVTPRYVISRVCELAWDSLDYVLEIWDYTARRGSTNQSCWSPSSLQIELESNQPEQSYDLPERISGVVKVQEFLVLQIGQSRYAYRLTEYKWNYFGK